MTDQTTEPDEALVEAVAVAIAVAECDPAQPGHILCGERCTFAISAAFALTGWHDEARAAIAAVRAYDAERAAGVPRCQGRVAGSQYAACVRPLGHHGGCR